MKQELFMFYGGDCMKSKDIIIPGKNVSLKLIKNTDIEEYYNRGFKSIDKEVQLYTGTKHSPTKESIRDYVNRIVIDESRYDFLIIDLDGQIIGESVINEIDTNTMAGHFRISLFDSENFGKGIGSEVIPMTLKFAFKELNLHRIELEVFSFNERGYKAYLRAGFIEEGRRRDAEFIGGKYCDVIIMGILRDEYLIKD